MRKFMWKGTVVPDSQLLSSQPAAWRVCPPHDMAFFTLRPWDSIWAAPGGLVTSTLTLLVPHMFSHHIHYCLCGYSACISYSCSQLSKISCCSRILLYSGFKTESKVCRERTPQETDRWPQLDPAAADQQVCLGTVGWLSDLPPCLTSWVRSVTHMMEGESPIPKVIPCALHVCSGMCVPTHKQEHIQNR